MIEDAPPSLTFDTPAGPSTATCTLCAQQVEGEYFTVNGQVACGDCRHGVGAALAERPGVRGWATSVVLGSAAGLAGAIVWWAIRRVASLEIGLIAVAIGHGVGLGVRRGSRGRGGRAFQVLAVLLTYFWTTANYVPDIMQEFAKAAEARVAQTAGTAPVGAAPTPGTAKATPAGATAGSPAAADASEPPTLAVVAISIVLLFAFTFSVAMAAPFLQGVENVIGLLIISFGLYQAWQLNTPGQVVVEGPFRLDAGVMPDARA